MKAFTFESPRGWSLLLVTLLLACAETSSPTSADTVDAADAADYVLAEHDASETAGDAPDDPIEASADVVEASGTKLTDCAPALAWWTENAGPDFLYGSPDLQLSPGGRLLARRDMLGDAYVRVRDGASLGHDTRSASGPLDAAWGRRLVAADGDRVELRDVATGESLLTLDELDASGWSSEGRVGPPALALLEGDGLAVARSCWYLGAGDERTTVTAWRLADGSRAWQTVLEGPCETFSWIEAPWLVPAGPQRMLTAAAGKASLVVLRTSDGAVLAEASVLAQEDGTSRPRGSWYGETLLALAVRPGGHEVALTTIDGRLHRRTLPDLAPVGESLLVGVVSINLNSYGASVESPVAWSPDGSLLAHLTVDGEAALSVADSCAEIARLPSPVASADGTLYPQGTPNPPTAFRFLPGGDGLVVAHERGLALWTCSGAALVAGDPLALAVSLSVESPLPDTSELTAHVITTGGHRPVVVQLVQDDVPLAFASSLGEDIVTWLAEGTYRISARVDDGVTSATSASTTVTVTPAR